MRRSFAARPRLGVGPFRGRDAVAAGLVTRRQLGGHGWRRLFRDVYLVDGIEFDHRTRCEAATLVDDRAVLSGRSAAYLWGVDVRDRSAPVELTVPDHVRIAKQPDLVVVRSTIEPGDVVWRSGVRVTSVERTAFDLGRRPPLAEAIVGLDAMLASGLVTRRSVAAYARSREGWRGSVGLRDALALADGGAESPMESRLRVVMIGGGLPPPVTQFRVCDPDGRFVARLDLAYPARRIGIEYEGDHHRSAEAFRHDLRRINALQAIGWTILRFSAADIYRNSPQLIATIRTALAR